MYAWRVITYDGQSHVFVTDESDVESLGRALKDESISLLACQVDRAIRLGQVENARTWGRDRKGGT